MLAVKSHSRFIGTMSTSDAVSLLKIIGGDHFFIRYCEVDQAYIISGIFHGVEITHVQIIFNQMKFYQLDSAPGKKFRNMSDMILYYLKFRGIEVGKEPQKMCTVEEVQGKAVRYNLSSHNFLLALLQIIVNQHVKYVYMYAS